MTAKILKPFGEFLVPGPNPGLVSLLEEALERAKAGEYIAGAISLVTKNHKMANALDIGSASYAELLGGVDVLKDDIKDAWNEDSDG